MTTMLIANLEKLLGGPRDGAVLRYSLGNEYLKTGHFEQAAIHLRAAIESDPQLFGGVEAARQSPERGRSPAPKPSRPMNKGSSLPKAEGTFRRPGR
jgi:hypothetical protein